MNFLIPTHTPVALLQSLEHWEKAAEFSDVGGHSGPIFFVLDDGAEGDGDEVSCHRMWFRTHHKCYNGLVEVGEFSVLGTENLVAIF